MRPKADTQDGHDNETDYKANLSATVILIDIHFSNTETALFIHFSNIRSVGIGDRLGIGMRVVTRTRTALGIRTAMGMGTRTR